MAQFARPDGDVTVTSFTGLPTNTAGNRYTNVDESAAADSDYCYGANNTAATYECSLSNVTDPNVTTGHTVRYRIARTNNGTVDGTGNDVTVTCSLYEGGTLIAAGAAQSTTGTWTEQSFTLTGTEAGNITDYTNLRLRFVTSASGGGPSVRRGAAISWAELEVPNVVTTVNLAGTINATSTVAGSLGITKNLAGSFASQSTVTGTLALTKNLAGTISAQSAASGTLSVGEPPPLNLAGTISAQSAATGSLGVTKNLSGSAASASAATGALALTKNLAGTISAQSAATGALSVTGSTVDLAGAINITSAAIGSLSVVARLAGVIAAQSTVSGALQLIKNLSGTIAATSTAVLNLRVQAPVGTPGRLTLRDRCFKPTIMHQQVHTATSRITEL